MLVALLLGNLPSVSWSACRLRVISLVWRVVKPVVALPITCHLVCDSSQLACKADASSAHSRHCFCSALALLHSGLSLDAVVRVVAA